MSDWNAFRGAARRLDDIDLPRIGHRIGVGEDELHAFMDVEAAGDGFDDEGRPKMLFEPHVFYRNLSGVKRARAVKAGLAYRNWGEKPYPADSYKRLIAAMAIDEAAALKSASWGLTQILGENHAMVGYDTPQALVRAFMEDEEAHLEACVAYLIAAGIADDLRAHRWEVVARGYNGPGYARHGYHTRMAEAFSKWRKIPDTPWQPDAADLPAISARMVSPGMRGAPVRALQRRLTALDHYDGAIDGIFGPLTTSAVETFQRAAGVSVDGYAGPVTLAALERAIAGEKPAPIIIPKQEAPMPAPIGHNGGPALEPLPSPMDQVRKPNGGAKWASVVGAIWVAVVSTGHIPPEFTTPEMLAAVTVVVTVVANWIGTYRSPKNAG